MASSAGSSMNKAIALDDAEYKKYQDWKLGRKPYKGHKFMFWEVKDDNAWVVTHTMKPESESKTQTDQIQDLQNYVSENYETKPCAITFTVKALEGADSRKTEKLGLIIWVPEECPAKVRFMYSTHQAKLISKLSFGKAITIDTAGEIDYADLLTHLAVAGKKLASVDKE